MCKMMTDRNPYELVCLFFFLIMYLEPKKDHFVCLFVLCGFFFVCFFYFYLLCSGGIK